MKTVEFPRRHVSDFCNITQIFLRMFWGKVPLLEVFCHYANSDPVNELTAFCAAVTAFEPIAEKLLID